MKEIIFESGLAMKRKSWKSWINELEIEKNALVLERERLKSGEQRYHL